jgi:GIY-YIG catalytic domain-containing protein
MIKLDELLKLSGIVLQDFKVHCATGKMSPPLEAFFDGKFKEWQERQNQKNFQCKHVLSLIHLQQNKWLFAGVFEILGVKQRKTKEKIKYIYSSREVKGLDHLTGRAIIQFRKDFRASYLKGEKHVKKLLVSEIRGERMSVGDFPGYNSVLLSYQLLCTIVREEIPSWKSALCNVAGVYIITDTETGKQYIGSAYGGDGIWHRWARYTKDGHGGNKELKDLLKKKGRDHCSNFQFSVLEVCDLNSNNEYVISRESHWKSVLLSREFGLNNN